MVHFHTLNNSSHPQALRNRALVAERRLREATEARSLTSSSAIEMIVGGAAASGAVVNTQTAMGVAAVTA